MLINGELRNNRSSHPASDRDRNNTQACLPAFRPRARAGRAAPPKSVRRLPRLLHFELAERAAERTVAEKRSAKIRPGLLVPCSQATIRRDHQPGVCR